MKHVLLTLSSCVLALGLVACDKKDADKSAEAKTEDKKDDAQKEPAAKQDDKPATVEKQEPERGVTGVIHATAGDEKPAEAAPAEAAPAEAAPAEAAPAEAALAEAAPAEVPHYDTDKDKGSMIGHLAGSIAHDDQLVGKGAVATLASLVIGDTTPSDAEICGHVLNEVLVKEIGDIVDDTMRAEFMEMCKIEIEKERIKLGPEVFAEAAACIMKATTLDAIAICDKAEQEAEAELHKKPHGDSLDKATCEAAIDHMFGLLRKEFASEPELLGILEADLQQLREDGVTMCMDEATKAEIECLMKAETLAALDSCS